MQEHFRILILNFSHFFRKKVSYEQATADTAKNDRFSFLDLWKQNFNLRAVKLFFLRLDAILMTQHPTLPGTGERSVVLYGIILGGEYANLLSSCTCS